MTSELPTNPVKLLLLIARLVWKHLALLVGMDVVLALALLPAAALAFGGMVILAPMAAALLAGPVWAGMVATTDQIARREDVSLSGFIGNIAANARIGLIVSLIPALVVTAFIGSVLILTAHRTQTWLLIPLAIDGCAATTIFLALPTLFSLATGSDLRGRALWRLALGITASRPSTILGLIALGLLLWLVVDVSGGPGLLPFVPGPIALYCSATTWAAIGALRRCQEIVREPFPALHDPLPQESMNA